MSKWCYWLCVLGPGIWINKMSLILNAFHLKCKGDEVILLVTGSSFALSSVVIINDVLMFCCCCCCYFGDKNTIYTTPFTSHHLIYGCLLQFYIRFPFVGHPYGNKIKVWEREKDRRKVHEKRNDEKKCDST